MSRAVKRKYDFCRGSSGSVYCAIKKYFEAKRFIKRLNVDTVLADRGDRYSNTIYDEFWRREFESKVFNVRLSV